MNKQFKFDGQVHVPLAKVDIALRYAIKSGLDAIIFTNYGNTENFDRLADNKNLEGKSIISPKEGDIYRKSSSVLEVIIQERSLYVIKGEEVVTKQGHLLVWGIQEPIENGIEIEDALRRAYAQGGLAVFSHLLTKLFHGCGKEVFKAMHEKFKGQPLGVEENGQIPNFWMNDNQRVRDLAKEYDVACFGTSDIHAKYRKEYRKIGLRNHSSMPQTLVDRDHIIESLRNVVLNDHQEIRVEGDTNSLLETIAWNVSSIRMDGWKKIADLWDGFLHSRRIE